MGLHGDGWWTVSVWYNWEHRHSAIRFVTPDERHCGREPDILARRHGFYQRAQASNSERWTRATRKWTPIGLVVLNPSKADLPVAA
jgi:putative transposase